MRDARIVDPCPCHPSPGLYERSFFTKTWISPLSWRKCTRGVNFHPVLAFHIREEQWHFPEHPNRVRNDLFEGFSHHFAHRGKYGSLFARRFLECLEGE